jgi:lysozyme
VSRRILALCAALLAAVLLAACGGTRTITRTVTVPQKVTTAPPSEAPETSITPSGPGNPSPAKPAPAPKTVALAASLQKRIDANGLHLIEGFEGFSSCPYWDAYGRVATRGYGETEGIHSYSPCISRAYGEANLRYRVERFYEPYLRAQHVDLNQNQWNAAISFMWNLGAGIWQGTTIGAELRARNFAGVASSMLQYVHAGGVVLAGLVTRRRSEASLFLKVSAHLTAAQLRQRRLHALHTQEGLHRALHFNIERHHCRPGQHTTPRFPRSRRLRYHRLCGVWLKEGQHAIRLINHYRSLLRLGRMSARAASISASTTAPAIVNVAYAPAEASATIPASPLGPTSSSGFSLAYGDAFGAPIGNAAGQDNTWWPNRGGSVSTACRPGDASNELEVYSSSQVSVTSEGLVLTAKHEANACGSGKDYVSGTVRSTSTEASGYRLPKWKPTSGETFVFEIDAKWPPSLGSGDPGWWSYDPVWTAELDMFEGWGWPTSVPAGDYQAGIPVWIWNTENCCEHSVRKETYSVLKDFGFDPTAGYHRYTTTLNADGSLDEYIDGIHKWHVTAPAGEVHRPWMGLAIQYGLRRPSASTYTTAPQFTSGSQSMGIRYAALWVDGAHAGQNIQNGGVAPGTTIAGAEPEPTPTTTETTPPPTAPAAPTGCSAITHREGTTSWLSASCTASSGATSYTLWRTEATAKSSTAKPGEAWASGTSPAFSNHIGVKQGERYCFREAAVNASGQSAPSPDFCVTA